MSQGHKQDIAAGLASDLSAEEAAALVGSNFALAFLAC